MELIRFNKEEYSLFFLNFVKVKPFTNKTLTTFVLCPVFSLQWSILSTTSFKGQIHSEGFAKCLAPLDTNLGYLLNLSTHFLCRKAPFSDPKLMNFGLKKTVFDHRSATSKLPVPLLIFQCH